MRAQESARFLVVDESSFAHDVLASAAQELSAVLVASTLADAVGHLTRTPFAAVILAVHGDGGAELAYARQLRNHHGSAELPLVFLDFVGASDFPEREAYALTSVERVSLPCSALALREKLRLYSELSRISHASAAATRALRSERSERRAVAARMALLVENIRDYAIITTASDGRILEWQGGAERITGYSAEEAVGQQLHMLFSREDRANGAPESEFEKARRRGRADENRWHLRKDGSRFFANGVMTPLYEEAGALRGYGVVFQNLTARAQDQQALHDAEHRLQLALKAGRLGTWELDLHSQRLTVSSICKANYGFGAEDEFSYASLMASVLEEDFALWRGRVEDAIRRAADLEVEYRVRWPDGSIHWVYVRASTTTDAHGHSAAMSGVSLNIDDRKRAVERLRLLDALAEATGAATDARSVMAITARLLGEHMAVTRCAYADLEPDNDSFTIRDDYTVDGAPSSVGVYSLDKFGERAASELRAGRMLVVDDVDRELAPDQGADMFNAIGVKAIVCCSLLKAGHVVALMAVHQARPRVWSADELALIQEVVARSWAYIERVRADQALREQDRRKDEFLATLAHELRNPLAPIRTGLQVLKLAPSAEAADKARGMMERQLNHMVRLVDDLLDVSRISRGKVELVRELVTLQAAIEHAVEATRPLIDAAGHSLRVSVPEEAVWVAGDLTRLAQVVSNLLNNSCKYTPHGGHIEVTLGVHLGQARIRVTDDGVGISKDGLPKVFDLFAQLDRTLGRAQGGLGIGLSLVRQLVVLHGGTIEAESAGLGQGSTFSVSLPSSVSPYADQRFAEAATTASVPHAQCEAQAPREAQQVLSARPVLRRIMVVDDNEDGAELLATVLSIKGHDVRTAHNGPDAVVLAEEFVPEVVFLDIGLPGMNGYDVAKKLRNNPLLARATLIALTGWGGEDDKRRAREAGFDLHLTKPVDPSAVQAALERLYAP